MPLRWTVVTYLLVEHVIEHDLDSALWSLHTLDIPEPYSRFEKYLVI